MKRAAKIFGSDGLTLLGTVVVENGGVQVAADDARIRRILVRLFDTDFDERVGIPPVRTRARKHTDEAFDQALSFITRHLGLVAAEVPSDEDAKETATAATDGWFCEAFVQHIVAASGFCDFDPAEVPGWASVVVTSPEGLAVSAGQVTARGFAFAERRIASGPVFSRSTPSGCVFAATSVPREQQGASQAPARVLGHSAVGATANTAVIAKRERVAA